MLSINQINTNNQANTPSFQALKRVYKSDFLKKPTQGRLDSIREFDRSAEIANFCNKYDVEVVFDRDNYDYAQGWFDVLRLYVSNFIGIYGTPMRVDLKSFDRERSLANKIYELKLGDLEKMLRDTIEQERLSIYNKYNK